MRSIRLTLALLLCLTLSVLFSSAEAQGNGKGYGGEKKAEHGQAQKAEKQAQPGKARGDKPKAQPEKLTGQEQARARREGRDVGGEVGREMAAEHGRGRGRFVRLLTVSEVKPVVRRLVVSTRPPEFVVGGAVAHAFARGLPVNALVIAPSGNLVLVRNRSGDVLLDLDDDRARNLGVWRVVTLDDRVREGAPSFCRSGAGHPVWGRQWCLDKGFGLGSEANVRWARAIEPGVVVFRETPEQALTRVVLRRVLGDVAFNRLAVHAITLGLAEPLTGVWLGEPSGPRVLLVSAGDQPVAEVVDVNRDNRVETLFVALRPW